MNFEILYYFQTDIICIGLIALVLILQRKHSRANTADVNFMRAIEHITLAYCASDLLAWATNGSAYEIGSYLNLFANAVYIGLQPLLAFVWLKYVYYKVDKEEFGRSVKGRALSFPLLLVCFLILSSPVTHFAFAIDENNVYHRNFGAYVGPVVCVIYLIYATVLLVQYLRENPVELRRDDIIPMIIFPIPFMITAVLQIIFYGLSINQVGLTFSLLLVFLNLQFNRATLDEITGLNNRRALKIYLNNLFQKKKEGTVFLTMIGVEGYQSLLSGYGRHEGERVLADVGDLLKKICRKQQDDVFLARYSDAEFVICGSDFKPEQLTELVESIKEAVKVYNDASDKSYNLNLNVGYSSETFAALGSYDRLLKKVDERLAAARKMNRE
ncbi:MAG: GGDEF domain-containing protein [Acetatifactor sp.]|nr:GGDEF domain-containing protein [Acetatifactor sp.]